MNRVAKVRVAGEAGSGEAVSEETVGEEAVGEEAVSEEAVSGEAVSGELAGMASAPDEEGLRRAVCRFCRSGSDNYVQKTTGVRSWSMAAAISSACVSRAKWPVSSICT